MPNRGTTLLVILQAWILPCSHGFTYTPFGPGSNWGGTGSARQSFTATQPRPLNADAAAVSGGTPLGQRMVGGGGENLDPSPDEPADVDNNPFGAPGPYRDEHTAGGSRFKELLARANGQGAPRPPPPPTAKPRRVLPPEGAPNYDDDSQWEEQAIGSPDVPDPPLRQEMPGLDLGPELGLQEEGEPGISGGSRFSRMMNQARQNDDRQEAGMAPRASPRSPQEVAKRAAQPAPVSKEEKERAIRAAVERQQKMMAKARGIDLDDPTLEGAELARKKALSRAQAESQAGGYVPSSSAADDYLNALKVDSQRKQAETQARLRGKPPPPRDAPLLSAPSTAPIEDSADEKPPALPSAQKFEPVRPQKRTQATWSIQNKADAYIASLKGIKVDLPEENPFLKKQQSLEELPPQRLPRPPPPPPAPPLGPKMTYAERLRLAKQAKAAGSVATAAAPDAPPSAPVTAAAAPVASPLVATEVPPPAPPSLGGSEEPKQAQENKAVVDAPPPRSALEQDIPEVALMGEDAAQAKMMRVMDLLTEHKTAGLVGEERVSELRSSLIDTREILRAETYGSSGGGRAMASPAAPPPAPLSRSPSPPPAQPQPQQQEQQQQQPPAPATSPAPAAPAAPPAPPTAISPESAETLRRCSALLQAHVHSSLAGQDLQALVEGLTSSLAIVTGQLVTQIAAGSGGSDSSSQPAGGSAPAGSEPAAAAGDGEVPAYVGGIQSVGGVLSDMGVGERPASFLPEEERSGGAAAEEGGTAGWTGGSLGEEDKAVATKALGYLLKHRGGKGYGRGRVSGKEAEAMVAALAEVTEIMQDEMVEE